MVVGAEMAGNDVGVGELVAGLAADRLEADRERRQPVLALLRQQPHDQARVQPARQQHPDLDVGHEAPAYRDSQ